jgi:uncharacterized membrane protein
MTDLGLLPGHTLSIATDINDCGDIVGYSQLTNDPLAGRNALLWREGIPYDLNDLILPGSGWTLNEAFGINEDGVIVGKGEIAGQGHGFVLNPVFDSPIVVGVGSRYLSVTPSAVGPLPIALLLTADAGDPDVACLSAYIQADGSLDPSPVYQVPSAWSTLFVTGSQILPATTYRVQSETRCGAQSDVGSGTTWVWGDANHTGIVDLDDITCVLAGFSGNFPGNCTIHGDDLAACSPTGLIDLDDIASVLSAFSGISFADTWGCAAPCP